MGSKKDTSLYRKGLERSRGSLLGRIRRIFETGTTLGEEQLEEIEEALILADIGSWYTENILSNLRSAMAVAREWSEDDLKAFLIENIAEAVKSKEQLTRDSDTASPQVILVVGVNGTGKTTSIGKLAYMYNSMDRKVIVVAADTYRAAADSQLEIWAERAQVGFFGGTQGRDPAAVVHDALNTARSDSADIVIIDTAGRLHTKKPLMKELEKITKVASRIVEGAPHEVLLVLDGTTGQNALAQARTFTETVGITGIILTKMDGTAKGGILVPIAGELRLPVKFLGMGEGIDELIPFDPISYAEALLG
ncbi:MAG: signal recognition particle-docking protein FtsY [bacterium]